MSSRCEEERSSRSWDSQAAIRGIVLSGIEGYCEGRFVYEVRFFNSCCNVTQPCSALLLLHSSTAFSASCTPSLLHLSPIIFHVLERIMPSTILSFLIKLASASVLVSLGKYLALYGSNRSSINLSRARASSVSRSTWSGSSGSGEVATPAQ